VVNLVTIFKVPYNKYFLFWHYWLFCTRMKIPGSYEPGDTILRFPDINNLSAGMRADTLLKKGAKCYHRNTVARPDKRCRRVILLEKLVRTVT
jgi:hypothetical protein